MDVPDFESMFMGGGRTPRSLENKDSLENKELRKREFTTVSKHPLETMQSYSLTGMLRHTQRPSLRGAATDTIKKDN